MALFSKPIKTLDDLFVHTLQDMYYAENQIVKALPNMIDKAHDSELKQAFQMHLRETENHVRRLEEVFTAINEPVKGVACDAMNGIISEAKDIMSDVADHEVLDAAMLSASQAVEHYEITRYGTLIALARQLGRTGVIGPLKRNLEEEKAADMKLTAIAESRVNRKAAA